MKRNISFLFTTGVMQAHLRTEAYLKESGVHYTIIREGTYFETYPIFLGFFAPTDTEVCHTNVKFFLWLSFLKVLNAGGCPRKRRDSISVSG